MNYDKIKKIPLVSPNPSPQNDVNMDGVWVKGKYPEGTGKKVHATMRGGGAATKGCKFLKT
jgi:hypothetical protein